MFLLMSRGFEFTYQLPSFMTTWPLGNTRKHCYLPHESHLGTARPPFCVPRAPFCAHIYKCFCSCPGVWVRFRTSQLPGFVIPGPPKKCAIYRRSHFKRPRALRCASRVTTWALKTAKRPLPVYVYIHTNVSAPAPSFEFTWNLQAKGAS